MNYSLLYFQQFHSVFMQHMTIVSFKFKQEVKKQSLTTELHSHDHLWHGGAIQPELYWVRLEELCH